MAEATRTSKQDDTTAQNTQTQSQSGTNWLIYAQLALGMALFGSATPVSKIITAAFPNFIASGLRMAIAGLILLPFVWRERHRLRNLTRNDKIALAGITTIGMFGFTVFLLYGMGIVSGVAGSIIMSTTPAVTAAGAYLFLDEKLGWRKIAAIILAVVGVLVLQITSAGETDVTVGALILGSVLVFLAVCSEASYTLFGRITSDALTPELIAGVTALGAISIFIIPALFQLPDFDWSQVAFSDWLALLWWGGGTLGLGSILWYSGVKQVSGGTAAGFMGVMPVSALVLSYVLLGEAFEWIHLVGFAIVFSGVLLVAWSHAQGGH